MVNITNNIKIFYWINIFSYLTESKTSIWNIWRKCKSYIYKCLVWDAGIEGNSGSDGKGEWSEMVWACVEEGWWALLWYQVSSGCLVLGFRSRCGPACFLGMVFVFFHVFSQNGGIKSFVLFEHSYHSLWLVRAQQVCFEKSVGVWSKGQEEARMTKEDRRRKWRRRARVLVWQRRMPWIEWDGELELEKLLLGWGKSGHPCWLG